MPSTKPQYSSLIQWQWGNALGNVPPTTPALKGRHNRPGFADLWRAMLLPCLVPPDAGAATVQEAWVRRFLAPPITNVQDYASHVVLDSAGDVIVTGTTDSRTSRLDMF